VSSAHWRKPDTHFIIVKIRHDETLCGKGWNEHCSINVSKFKAGFAILEHFTEKWECRSFRILPKILVRRVFSIVRRHRLPWQELAVFDVKDKQYFLLLLFLFPSTAFYISLVGTNSDLGICSNTSNRCCSQVANSREFQARNREAQTWGVCRRSLGSEIVRTNLSLAEDGYPPKDSSPGGVKREQLQTGASGTIFGFGPTPTLRGSAAHPNLGSFPVESSGLPGSSPPLSHSSGIPVSSPGRWSADFFQPSFALFGEVPLPKFGPFERCCLDPHPASPLSNLRPLVLSCRAATCFPVRKTKIMAVGIHHIYHGTPFYPQKLALTSPTSGGC
jgi:hypothetical protein